MLTETQWGSQSLTRDTTWRVGPLSDPKAEERGQAPGAGKVLRIQAVRSLPLYGNNFL